jgi:hypothetical protein
MYHERRIRRLTLWLSKHLVIMFRKEIFKNGNRCLVKPRVMFWKTRFNLPLRLVKSGTQVRPPPQAGQIAHRGATLLQPQFLPRLLRTKWEIGEHLWLSICRILKV